MALIEDGETFVAPRTGIYNLLVDANGGTVQLELSLDKGTTYVNMTDGSFSADATKVLELTEGATVRVQTTGSAAAYIDA
jgi:hypothetical protein